MELWYHGGKTVQDSQGKFWRAVSIMIGSIVGVGVFGLPYAFAQSGYVIGLVELIAIALLMFFLQLMFAEIVVQTNQDHRFAGYIEATLGHRWSLVAMSALACAYWGAMTAYMIVGGKFLTVLLFPFFGGTESVYAILLAVVAGFFVYRGLGVASKIESIIVAMLILLFVFIMLVSLPHVSLEHLLTFHPDQRFVPYGVILFSLAGMGIVPEMRAVLGRRGQGRLGQAILVAFSIVFLLYVLFSTIVLGVTGSMTTQAAFDGLVPVLGPSVALIASFLGSLTILSVFMILGIQLKQSFVIDYHVPKQYAWLLVMFVPCVLYLLGVRELIELIGFIGSVFTGVLGVLLACAYRALLKSPTCHQQVCARFPMPIVWLIIFLFASGSVWSLFLFIFPFFL